MKYWKFGVAGAILIILASGGFFAKKYLDDRDTKEIELRQELNDEKNAKEYIMTQLDLTEQESAYYKNTIDVFGELIEFNNNELLKIEEERTKLKGVLDDINIVENYDWFAKEHPDDLANLLSNSINGLYGAIESATQNYPEEDAGAVPTTNNTSTN